MSQAEDQKKFKRQHNRFQPNVKRPRGRSQRTGEVTSSQISQISSQVKEEIIKEETIVSSFTTQKLNLSFNISKPTVESLRKAISIKKDDLANLFKDKIFRQQIRKEEKRLTKMRVDEKVTEQSDIQLSLIALNNVLNVSEEVINGLTKEEKAPNKNIIRLNQEKEMSKLLTVIDEQLAENNILGAKSSIQNILKRFGKDDFLEGKVLYLNYIQNVSELYEKESNKINDLSKYLERLSNVDNSTPETVTQSNNAMKSLKKDLALNLTKQNKKTDKNVELIKNLTEFDKIATVLAGYLEPKKSLKRQMSTSKDMQVKGLSQSSSTVFEDGINYCRDIFEKTGEDKQALFKQIQTLKRNRKKATESPFNLLIKIYDQIAFQKKEINECNLYLKTLSQIYFKKNINNEVLQTELKKAEEKYPDNQVIGTLKPNLDHMILTIQEKERSGKELQNLEQQIKKLRTQNERLNKVIQNQKSKIVDKVADEQKSDRKKQMEERRQKQMQKSKADKLQKEIEKALENVFNNLGDKKWKATKNAINVFIKRFEDSDHHLVPRSLQSFNAINNLLTQVENDEAQINEYEKKQKTMVRDHEKEKQNLEQKIIASEDYDKLLKDLLENYSQDKYPLKKFFDDIRRDRKKIVQQKYLLLNKLEQPLNQWRSRKFESDPKNVSLTYSEVSAGSKTDRSEKEVDKKSKDAEVKLNELNKDIEELLNLVKKIDKGGEWWKFIPKNIKNNATFKPVYNILEQYRKYELNIQALETNTNMSKDEDKVIDNALTTVGTSIAKDKAIFSEDYWTKKLMTFKGKSSCDKLTKCLNDLNSKFNGKLLEENQKVKGEIDRLNGVISNLERNLSDKQRSVNLVESSSKKSIDLKSSRRSSRSREKKEDKKEIIESFIQDERNYLNKIEEAERQTQRYSDELASLQMKMKATQQELGETCSMMKNLESAKAELEQQKYRQFNEINNLKGELEIAEGRILEVQNKFQSELGYYKELSEKVQSKIVEESSKTKQLEHENKALKQHLHGDEKNPSELDTESRIRSSQVGSSETGEDGIHLDFKFDFAGSHVIDFKDVEAQRARRRQLAKATQQKMKAAKAQQAKPVQPEKKHTIEDQLNELRKYISVLEQKLQFVSSENNKNLLVITDLTTQNNDLKIRFEKLALGQNNNDTLLKKIQELQQQKTLLMKEVEIIQSLEQQKQILMKQVQRIQSLEQQKEILIKEIERIGVQKRQEIQREVAAAVQGEVNKFNAFLETFKADQEKFYLNEVLPQKIQEAVAKIKIESSPVRGTEIDVNSQQFLILYQERYKADALELQNRSKLTIERQISNFKANELPRIIEERLHEQKISLEKYHQEAFDRLKQQIEAYWTGIVQQKQRQIQTITNAQSSTNVEESIEQWKQMYLGSIIEQEQKTAIDLFVQNELPKILDTEYNKWMDAGQIEKQDLLKEEWVKWEASRDEEVASRLKEIQINYQAQIIQWQQKLFKEQQRSTSIEKSFKLESERWSKQRSTVSATTTVAPEVVTEYQNKLSIERNKVIELQNEVVNLKNRFATFTVKEQELFNKIKSMETSFSMERNEWQKAKAEEISKILAIQLRQCEEFHQSQFTRILALEKQNWDSHQQEQINIILLGQRNKWEQDKEAEFEQRKILILQEADKKTVSSTTEWHEKEQAIRRHEEEQYNIKLNNLRAEWERAKAEEIKSIEINILNIERQKWQVQKQNQINHLLAQETQKFNIKLNSLRGEWQRGKAEEIRKIEVNILNVEHQKWEVQKQNDINLLLAQEKQKFNAQLNSLRADWQKGKGEDIKKVEVNILNIELQKWQAQKQSQINHILTQERQNFNSQINNLRAEWQRAKVEEIRTIEVNILNVEHQKWQIQKQNEITHIIAQERQRFNVQINNLRAEWQKGKGDEIKKVEVTILNAERQKWQVEKQNEINQILIHERQLWVAKQNEEINIILSKERQSWQKQKDIEFSQITVNLNQDVNVKIQNQCKIRLENERALWMKQKEQEWNTRLQAEKQSWQQIKTAEINAKAMQVETYWQTNVLAVKEKEWQETQNANLSEVINTKLAEFEKEFHEVRIPAILQRQYQLWVEDNNRNMAIERQNWLKNLSELLSVESNRVYIEPFLKKHMSQYEDQIRILRADIVNWENKAKQIQSTHSNSSQTIRQLESQLSQNQLRFDDLLRQKQRLEGELVNIKNQHQIRVQQTVSEAHRLNEELSKSRAAEQDIFELKKIIDMQKEEIRNISLLHQEIEALRKENLTLKENNISLQNARLHEVSQLRDRYESELLQLTTERKRLITQLSDNEVNKLEGHEKDSFLSLERQIATLLATIKTKDAEIAFLKRSIDTHKDQLTEARDQYSIAFKQKHEAEKKVEEIKGSKKQVDIQLKYLKEREDSLKRKVEELEDELTNSRNKPPSIDVSVIQSKTESVPSFQQRFTQIESMLTLKTQECHSMTLEVDRLRYELQRFEASNHSHNLEIESLKSRLRDSEAHYSSLKLEHDRAQDELSRTKMSLNQSVSREEEINKKLQIHTRTLRNEESDKLRVESQLHKMTEQYNKIWRDFNEMERVNRKQAEKSMILERELKDVRGRPQVDSSELQMLNKINNEVSQLTAVNRQLTMKITLLENQERVNTFSQDILKFFLLLQKHTDLLIDSLLKDGLIPNLEPYHRFLSDSRPYIASGQISVYFSKWQVLFKQLFQCCLASRSEEMRTQAEELMHLKEQMNDILEKQIEASESDSGQLVEDYKAVLIDIKSLVREYVNSGDRDYLSLLCQSLAIPQK